MLAFKLWAHLIQGYNIIFFSDNMSVVEVINNKTSKDPIMSNMIRQMMITSLFHDIEFSSKHIPGRHNDLSDMLSRLQTSQALALAPWLQKDPAQVPADWMPW